MAVKYLITEENTAKLSKEAKVKAFTKVVEAFEKRAKNLGYKMHTKTGKNMQMEFILGATAMLDALAQDPDRSQILPSIYVNIMRGDLIKVEDL